MSEIVADKILEAKQDSIWTKIRNNIKNEFGQEVFDKWLSKLELHSVSNQEVIMSVSSKFLRDWIKREYLESGEKSAKGIKNIWQEENSEIKKVSIIYVADIKEEAVNKQSDGTPGTVVNLSKYDNIFALGVDLNPKFTFENFVTGKSNKLAYGMARIIAGAEDSQFSASEINPLFLYGGVGLGKTHLAQAIAWHIKENNKSSRVIYLSAERFMYQFVQSLRNKDVMDFKERFRAIDVLIIDDLQFLAGKEGTQTELLHTLNSLIENGKQVVLVCDKSPGDINDIDEKLKSRISGGFIADFKCPDYETRLEILKSKIKNLNITIENGVLELLAGKISSSVRDLEGAVRKMIANHMFTGEIINIENAKNLLKDLFRTNHNVLEIEQIQKKVADHFNIKIADLKSNSRSRNVARPRQIGMYICRNLTNKSLPDIGREFGGKNHATVIHAIKKVEELILADVKLASEVKALEGKI